LIPLTSTTPTIEVNPTDTAVLAIVLQYRGNVPLDGLTGALKLPSGFQAWGQTRNSNYDVAFSNFNSNIQEDSAIVLCFGPIKILPKAPLITPVVGLLALNYLREQQPISTIDSFSTQQMLSFMHTLTFAKGQNSTTFLKTLNPGLDTTQDFENTFTQSNGANGYQPVDQITPVIFQVTGRTIFSVQAVLSPAPPKNSTQLQNALMKNVVLPASCNSAKPTPQQQLQLAFTNLGNVPVHTLVATVSTAPPSAGTSLVSPYGGWCGGVGGVCAGLVGPGATLVTPYGSAVSQGVASSGSTATNFVGGVVGVPGVPGVPGLGYNTNALGVPLPGLGLGSNTNALLGYNNAFGGIGYNNLAAIASNSVNSAASPIAITGANSFYIGTLNPGEPPVFASSPHTHVTGKAANVALSNGFTPGVTIRSNLPCTGQSSNIPSNVPINSPLYVQSTYTNAVGQRFTQVTQVNVPTST
jgi:hypothetical protein